MLGAIIGDIVGSRFEFNNHRNKHFELFTKECFVTDDSIMTIAVAKAILETEKSIELNRNNYYQNKDYYRMLSDVSVKYMQELGRKYPNCGYGGMFASWIFSENPKPYNSFGNGAAMRISPAGFTAFTQSEAIRLAETITSVTHNHKEGIKGAEATAVAIFMARQGALKSDIRQEIASKYYSIDFTIDEIRTTYEFNETCQATVPQAMACFFESVSFEDAIRTAISLGGDSDTIAAITGAIAEAYYGIPDNIRNKALTYLNSDLQTIFDEWEKSIGKNTERFKILTKYISKISSGQLWGEWIVDYKNDDTSEHKEQLLLEKHNNLTTYFIKEFYQFADSHPEYQLTSYDKILECNGIKFECALMNKIDLAVLDEQCILALIMAAIRSERFCDGTLLSLSSNGSFEKWLKRLKDIDSLNSKNKLTEVYLESLSMMRQDTYRLLFANKRAYLMTGSFRELRFQKVYSIKETEKLINDWNDIHIEYWKSYYPQEGYMIQSCGVQWSLFVSYEGSRGMMFGGDNTYPKSWHQLLALFDVEYSGEDDIDDEETASITGRVIYCQVSFNDDGKSYYYQTKDRSIEIKDHVFVPVGPDDHEEIAVIEKIEYFEKNRVPFPLNKTKHIIAKANIKNNNLMFLDNFVLCNEKTSHMQITVWAEISNGCLKISGQDLGKGVEDVFGKDEYEYFYDFDQENTERLFILLNIETQSDAKAILIQNFSGIDGDRSLREFCDSNELTYRFFCH